MSPSQESVAPVLERLDSIIREVVAPNADHHDSTSDFPVENFRRLGEAGLLGLYVPKAYGGLEGTHQLFVKVVERLGQACASTAMMYVMHHNQYIMVVEHGTERQRNAFLPPIARGESLFGSATTEIGTGGNADHCVSARVRDGDHFVVSAKKPVVSGAKHVSWVCLTTRRDPDAPSNALTMMIVPGLAGGGERVRPFGTWDCIGMRATGSSGLEYVDCRVPAWHALGGDSADLPRATSMGPVAIIGFSAVWLGITQAAYEVAIGHLTGRSHQYIRNAPPGSAMSASAPPVSTQVRVSEYEGVQRQVAEMRAKVESARAVLHVAAQRLDELRPGPTQALSLEALGTVQELMWSARLSCSEAAVEVCRMALRLCGVEGLRRGKLPLERHLRDALTAPVMAPSEDITKLMLGRKALGVTKR